ncbi:MAG: transposase [Candidatus Thermoplasmatota archaeon]|nr:transposase [Candidatus Thermoplasmatota archaeon]
MEDNGDVNKKYEILNDESAWAEFRERYLSVHLADPVKLVLIFNATKKNDREDSYKLAKLLRLGELPDVHLPSRYSDDLRSLIRYRRSLGEIITMIKKSRVHAILASAGINIVASDIF